MKSVLSLPTYGTFRTIVRKGGELSSFQSGDLLSYFGASGEYLVPAVEELVMAAELVPMFVDIGLQQQSKFDFLPLDDQKRDDSSEETCGGLAGDLPSELDAVLVVPEIVPVLIDGAAVSGLKLLNDGAEGHADASRDLVSSMGRVRFLPDANSNVAFSVEQAGGISVEHQFLSTGDNGIVANSEKTRCPAERCGRVTPSQAGARQALGVCNEHVPLAEAEMCSGLHGNMQMLAEMTSGGNVFIGRNIHYLLTDCNTNYLFLRPYAEREFVPLEPERFSVNQDAMVRIIAWAGNMTMSNRFLQAVLTN